MSVGSDLAQKAIKATVGGPDDGAEQGGDPYEDAVNGLIAELLDTADLDNIPALEPLIDDVLFRDTLARVYGASGAFKSFMTIGFAGSVGTGMEWHGRTVRQGLVIYIVAEGVKGVRKRVRAWEQYHDRKMTGVKFLPRPVQVRSPEWDVLIEVCRRLQPALVIVDTQARVTVGVEENSATEMGVVLHHVEQMRAASEACVLLVHHTGIDGDRGRGSTSIKGGMQTELGVSRKGKGRDLRVTLSTGKQKDDEELGDVVFMLKVIELNGEAKEDGSPVTSVVLVPEDVAVPTTHPPGSVPHLVAQLDAARIPNDWGRDRIHKELLTLGFTAGKDKLAEIVRVRKARDLPRDLPYSPVTLPAPDDGAGIGVSPDQTCPGQVRDSFGAGIPDLPAPSPPPIGRGQVGQPSPACTVCGKRLDPLFATTGTTTCLTCLPQTGDT